MPFHFHKTSQYNHASCKSTSKNKFFKSFSFIACFDFRRRELILLRPSHKVLYLFIGVKEDKQWPKQEAHRPSRFRRLQRILAVGRGNTSMCVGCASACRLALASPLP
jgi:hypothetical protein